MFSSLLLAGAISQPAVKVSDLVGDWQGTLQIFQPGKDKPHEVLMKLNIASIKGTEGFTYQIIYPGQAPRNYKLLPIDAPKGHWQIDEQNGIKVDCFWNGSGFTSCFSVQGTMLITSKELQGDKLVWSLSSFETKVLSNSGGVEGAPTVTTQRLLSSQKAVMSRTAGKPESSS